MIHFIKNLFMRMEPGQIIINRQFDRTDPRRDKTVITYCGSLDAPRLAGIKAILEGKATARRKPGKGVQA